MEDYIVDEMFDYIDSCDDRMRSMLAEMAAIESPSACKEGVDKVCEYIKNICEGFGMSTKVYEYENAGNSFTAVMNEDSPRKAIALMGHMDTVHPVGTFGNPAVKTEGDYIYGPGVYDCKGGLVIAILTCMTLKKFGYTDRPVKLLFSGDEEVGHSKSDGAEIFLKDTDKMAAALNCESGLLDGRIVTGRKSGIGMKLVIEGIAAHSGNAPQNGRSAIREAAYKIIEIEKNTDFQGTTYNCGVISGGTVPNQIPDRCEVTIDVRVKTQQAADEAIEFMESVAGRNYVEGTKTTLIISRREVNPMEQDEKNMKLFSLFVNASDYVGAVKPTSYFSGGGSDSSLTSRAGVPTICAAGIRGADNHALTERALLTSITERAKILTKLILDFPEENLI